MRHRWIPVEAPRQRCQMNEAFRTLHFIPHCRVRQEPGHGIDRLFVDIPESILGSARGGFPQCSNSVADKGLWQIGVVVGVLGALARGSLLPAKILLTRRVRGPFATRQRAANGGA